MIGIVVAMKEEAQPIISRLELEKKDTGFYANKDYILVICGIGKCNAQNATWSLMGLGVDKIVNVGSCGYCGINYGLGDVILPNTFWDGDFDLSAFGNPTKDPCEVNAHYFRTGEKIGPKVPIPCYTYSTFITDSRVKEAVVEMEAYAIASACARVGVPFVCIKVVSDGGNPDAVESFKKEVESNKFAPILTKVNDTIVDMIKNFDVTWAKEYETEDIKED